MHRTVWLLVIVFAICSVVYGQQANQGVSKGAQPSIEGDIDRILGRRVTPFRPSTEDYDALQGRNFELEDENKRLAQENVNIEATLADRQPPSQYAALGAGITLSLFVVWVFIRIGIALRRVWRLSVAGKQLVSLVVGATCVVSLSWWVMAASDGRPNLAALVVASLPGIFIAGIAYWWFEKAKSAEV
jgi:hypothetical protein